MAAQPRIKQLASSMPKKGSDPKANPRDAILPNIRKGTVIPIISSSFRMEQIFHELAEDDGSDVVEELIAQWAESIEYPLPDRSNLAQVAQYYFVDQNDDPGARIGIFNYLKHFIWRMANTEVEDQALADGLESGIEERLLSDLVEELDYPQFPDGTEDPLRLLARLPLPVYITTSQSDFLERALEAEEKNPHTQICFWSGEIPNLPEKHRPVPPPNPSITNPLVYHLFGLEDYPQTLVLSEDDFISFLIAVTEDTNTLNPKIPLYLRQAVAGSQLLLIGYQLSGWDFRVLFRLMMKFRIERFSPRGMLIQLEDKEKQDSGKENQEASEENQEAYKKKQDANKKAVEYLRNYFGKKSFDIVWSDADSFIQDLWSRWNIFR
jgi:hypothetical protein